MKKLALVLVTAVIILLCACGTSQGEISESTPREQVPEINVMDVSKSVYDNINLTYNIVKDISDDIYTAWRIGIYDRDDVVGASYLAEDLNLSEEDVVNAASYIYLRSIRAYNKYEEDWKNTEYYRKMTYADNYLNQESRKDNLVSACVNIIIQAYVLNEKFDEAQATLDSAKTQLKELDEDRLNLEYYDILKKYYISVSAYLDLCKSPSGTLSEIKNAFDNYENEARGYMSDLDFAFD